MKQIAYIVKNFLTTAMEISHQPLPLKLDSDGTVRVGGTRIPIDTIIIVFNRGATAEEIVQQYPSLELADVYAVIGYYLRNREEVDAYLEQRKQQASAIREQNESNFDVTAIRERLLSRQLSNL